MTQQNLPYLQPETGMFWDNFQELRRSFPNMSLPEYQDIPELGVYQLHYVDVEAPVDFYVYWEPSGTYNEDDGKYYRNYVIKSIEDV